MRDTLRRIAVGDKDFNAFLPENYVPHDQTGFTPIRRPRRACVAGPESAQERRPGPASHDYGSG